MAACYGHWFVGVRTAPRCEVKLRARASSHRAMGLHCSASLMGHGVGTRSPHTASVKKSWLLGELAEPCSSHPENGDGDESCHGC